MTGAPAVAYGTVYIIDLGTLYAVDALTGKEKWRLQGHGLNSDPIIADGIIYFARTEDNLGILFGGKPTGYLSRQQKVPCTNHATYLILIPAQVRACLGDIVLKKVSTVSSKAAIEPCRRLAAIVPLSRSHMLSTGLR